MTDMPPRPLHPVPELTTSELNTYRGQLEHAIQVTPEHDAVMMTLRKRLDVVLAEQDERARIARAS